MEHIAEIGASYAEEMYSELKIKMNHLVTRRVPLIFYNTYNRLSTNEYYSRIDSRGCWRFFRIS